TPVINSTPNSGYQQQPRQQAPQQFNNHNRTQRTPQFDPIPMSYTELLPALIEKNLIQTRAPPPVPTKLPWWYRSDLFCAFHQGAPGHDIDHCLALKSEVQRLTFFQHNHAACAICPRNPRGFQRVRDDIQGMLDRRELVITYKRKENEDSNEEFDSSIDYDVFVIIPEFNIPKPVEVTFN
ncbi:hypothetical protein A2U01_0035502, partial [Trifolium medium]|nr:hypothetical protein [Trifolium medium]